MLILPANCIRHTYMTAPYPALAMFSSTVVAQFHGPVNSKQRLHSAQLKQNTTCSVHACATSFLYELSFKNSLNIASLMTCLSLASKYSPVISNQMFLKIIKAASWLPTLRLFATPAPNIFPLNTITSMTKSSMEPFKLSKSTPMTIGPIFSPNPWYALNLNAYASYSWAGDLVIDSHPQISHHEGVSCHHTKIFTCDSVSYIWLQDPHDCTNPASPVLPIHKGVSNFSPQTWNHDISRTEWIQTSENLVSCN